jgi:uncharacterized protein YkwD
MMRVRMGARPGAAPEGGQTRGSSPSTASVIAALLALVVLLALSTPAAQATPYSAQELDFLRLINEYRQQNGVGKLLLSDTASLAAARHSSDMGRYQFFNHDTVRSDYFPAGSTFVDRMNLSGYNYATYRGENIAAGHTSASTVFAAWRGSAGHNANMLNTNFRVIGIGYEYVAGSPYGHYWTTDFGGYVDPSAHDPSSTSTTLAPTTTTTAPALSVTGYLLAGGPNSYVQGQPAFWFDGSGYRSTTGSEMVAGRGYWVRLGSGAVKLTTDANATSLYVWAGWNLVGNATGVTRSLPSGLVGYRYNGSTYFSSTVIPAGEGAWVRRASAGTLTLR